MTRARLAKPVQETGVQWQILRPKRVTRDHWGGGEDREKLSTMSNG